MAARASILNDKSDSVSRTGKSEIEKGATFYDGS
jgi:hypothetical protein